MKKRVLVVDVGGTYTKLLMSRRNECEFGSGRGMRPQQLIAKLKESVRGWKFPIISVPVSVHKALAVRRDFANDNFMSRKRTPAELR